MWTLKESNPQPSRCKRAALPLRQASGPRPVACQSGQTRTGDPSLPRRVRFPLRYRLRMGLRGLEPLISRLRAACSDRLSCKPIWMSPSDRSRTCNLQLKRLLRCQLRHRRKTGGSGGTRTHMRVTAHLFSRQAPYPFGHASTTTEAHAGVEPASMVLQTTCSPLGQCAGMGAARVELATGGL